MNSFTSAGSIIAQLIESIAVIDLLAIAIQSSRRLSKIRGDENNTQRELFLGLIGGLFGIYATIGGFKLPDGALVSIRDVGPMMAGCLGGPLSGLIAGIIAGVQRLIYGLPDIYAGTTIPCSISTLIIGPLCGVLFKKFHTEKHRGLKALAIAAGMEVLHLAIVFCYLWPYAGLSVAREVLSSIWMPFMAANCAAFGTLIFFLDLIRGFKKTETHQKQIETELNVANSIQRDMLPEIFPDYPGRSEFEIAASMHPAKEVGGDFYDFFFIGPNHFALVIADVSGKGVPAALFMVISKVILKNNLQSGMSVADACTRTNSQLSENNESEMFVTAWVGVLEISTGRLTYVNAGHNSPLIKRHGKSFEYLSGSHCLVMAGMKDFQYRQQEIDLNDGDCLFLYTDGITEAVNESSEQYGETRLQDILNRNQEGCGPEQLIQSVTKDVTAYVNTAEQFDDQTMLDLCMSGTYSNMKVTAVNEHTDQLTDFMNRILENHRIDHAMITRMDIVLDELYSNVVNYSGAKDCTFGVSCTQDHISLQLEYGGASFDMTKTQDPDINTPLMERSAGGLGLLIVRKTMDDVQYRFEHGNNIVTAIKYLNTEESHGSDHAGN
ncbi:MAG: SpoIIE family protein phosphatase [Solobacterium sp.]|jgi:anti-sigma regulatory factor (Ser/Thr protein kinase)|nr:SpoIIE family protein phosphatase [Solobacterium sp.]